MFILRICQSYNTFCWRCENWWSLSTEDKTLNTRNLLFLTTCKHMYVLILDSLVSIIIVFHLFYSVMKITSCANKAKQCQINILHKQGTVPENFEILSMTVKLYCNASTLNMPPFIYWPQTLHLNLWPLF